MLTKKMTIVNSMGLHMRPGGFFAQEMGKFQCDVFINFKNNRVNGKSMINIMTACILCGSDIEIECNGIDEEAAMSRVSELIEQGGLVRYESEVCGA